MKKIARIKDIAERANVSAGTVDRVIHNRGRVSENAKKRILKAMEELKYEPNMMARALVSSGEFRIAALIPDPTHDEYWEAPFRGVDEAEAQMRQYGVIVDKFLFEQNDVESFKHEAQRLSEMSYKGILVAPIFYRESLAFLSKWSQEGIPFNLFNTHIPDYEPVTYVGQDSYQSGLLAGKLLHYGSKEPGTFIVAQLDKEVLNSTHLVKKEQGFMDYFEESKENGFKIVRAEINNWDDERSCHKQLDELVRRNSDLRGFFVTNSRSFVIGDYLKKNGLEYLQLVGYDLLTKNIGLLNEGVVDFLINQNPRGQGYWGVRLLVDHLVFRKEVDQIKYLPLDVVTKENLQYYI
ncbi:LacI family DNA-binding transcriptional regulator [Marinilabilia rubra]|uniref:LacI family transcriptional regulator n=1 Tax=Marinilabilia rubra TaxID=2162893 RepID=A0A2U2BBF5_9BACT|nr:substrate-binding domain-containing protein [Marinilabilia rubra]PWE00405.1 LacI family transcriptional regulator [Marinilabilia rubra]